MLYVLTGDVIKAKARAQQLAKGYEVVRVGEGGEALERAAAYLNARGLFSKKVALIIERPLETEAGVTWFHEELKKFADSETLTIVIEPELNAASRKMIPESAEVAAFEVEARPSEQSNVFALADAYASGERKKVWILYRTFIENGIPPEELHGILSWQVRAMVLASKTKSADEAGLKPFVYAKAKKASARFTEGGVDALSRELVTLYHESRAGKGDLEDLLEIFLLKK